MYLPLLLVLMRLSLGTVNAATSITFPQTTSMRPGDVILVKGFLRNRKMPFRLRIDTFRNDVILLDLRGMRHQIFIRPDYLQKRNSIRPGRKFLLKLRLTTNSLLIYLDTAIEKEIPFQDSIRKVAMQYSYRSGEVLKVDRDTYTCRSGIQSCGSPELFIDSPKQLCPATQVRKKIVGGQPSSPGANPWQVSIRKKNPYPGEAPHVCGGVLIDSCWVLSATHCFPMDTARATYLVRVGDYYNRDDMAKAFRNLENSKDFNIEKIFKAPNYNTSPSTRNDLTLIRLEDDNNDNICAEYGPFVKPVCLPTAADTYPIGNRECVITGWGATEQGQALENYPPCLQNAGVNLISKSECELSYPRNGKHQRILDTMVCAEARGKDSCQGDSGGPLVCSSSNEGPYTIWGITSWGEGCASKPGVYTKIFSFTNWIEEAMGDYCNYDPW